MGLGWFNAREAAAVGAALADRFAAQSQHNGTSRGAKRAPAGSALQDILRRADGEVRTLQLNVYKRAKLANSFKWTLLEKGVDKGTVEQLTQVLLMHLMSGASAPPAVPADSSKSAAAEPEAHKAADKPAAGAGGPSIKELQAQGVECLRRGECEQAVGIYQALLALKPRSAEAHNNLGSAYFRLERHDEAEVHLRQALKLKPEFPEALLNLGSLLQWRARFGEAEALLRRALKLQPGNADARSMLGKTLALQNRIGEARGNFEKVLKIAPRSVDALLGMGQVAAIEGRFDDAETWYQRVLAQTDGHGPPLALAALAGLRRMRPSDQDWLERAQRAASSGLAPAIETGLRFAIGKYYDDVGDYARAFEAYKRANELAREFSPPYQPAAFSRFVDATIGVYTREALAAVGAGGSDSSKPVLVVGMPRSGTTLLEQIIASHPSAAGAGELDYWTRAASKHELEMHQGLLAEPSRQKLAQGYLQVLSQHSTTALRVVNKAPVNANYLGLIHSVLPRARILYMKRDPIDTCLSCYFQPFYQTLNYTMDLSDLEHYCREHYRLMAHWRAALPPGTLLEVSYEELVADQPACTRRVLEFLDLKWDPACLDFHQSHRAVVTSSSWQVRQRIYGSSVQRWRNYEKYLGPLLKLRTLPA